MNGEVTGGVDLLKLWAKSVYLVAVVSSAALLMIPRSMQKQARFVVELMLLLCIMAPLAGFAARSQEVFGIRWERGALVPDSYSLENFYAMEVKRRALEMGEAAGLSIHSVEVETRGTAPEFSGTRVYVYLNPPVDESGAELIERFRELLAANLGIDPDNIACEPVQE